MVKRDTHVKSEESHHICMPHNFNFTCAVVGNNVYARLLHAYIRHYPELEAQIPSLSALRANLPAKMQAAMKARSVLHKAQMMILRYFESVMAANQTPQVTSNASGKYQLRYAVKNNIELVLGPSDPKAPNPSFDDRRPVGYITTAFLV